MQLFLGILFVIAVPLLVLAIQRTLSKVKKDLVRTGKRPTGLQASNPWRAASIVFNGHACEAVKAIGNKYFLDIEANFPALPLPNCDVSACNCKYAFYEDRRERNEDRRHPASRRSERYDRTGQPTRRQRKRGRRKGDGD